MIMNNQYTYSYSYRLASLAHLLIDTEDGATSCLDATHTVLLIGLAYFAP